MRLMGFAALLTLTAVVACTSPQDRQAALQATIAQEGWEPVAPSDLPAYFSDTTLSGTTDRGSNWITYFAPDGTMRGTSSRDGATETDSGTYMVNTDGTWCRTWTGWSSGRQGCARVYHRNEQLKHVVVSGRIGGMEAFVSDFTTGNPHGL